jgi:hypothetical protein
MAGTLTISTLSDGTNSTSATNCIQGSAKAWVNFNGTGTVAIRASYNVSSITDNGTGDYTVNFTNAMSDTNYVVVATGNLLNTDWNKVVSGPYLTQTTSQYRLRCAGGTSGTPEDFSFVSVAVFR